MLGAAEGGAAGRYPRGRLGTRAPCVPGETQTLSHCFLWAGAVPPSSPDSLSGLGLSLPHTLGAHSGATPNPACEPHPLEVQSLAWVEGGGGHGSHRAGQAENPQLRVQGAVWHPECRLSSALDAAGAGGGAGHLEVCVSRRELEPSL